MEREALEAVTAVEFVEVEVAELDLREDLTFCDF